MISNRELALEEREQVLHDMTTQERCDFKMLECEQDIQELFEMFESKIEDDGN